MLRIIGCLLCLIAPAQAFQEPYKGPLPVQLKAADGVVVHGWHHSGRGPLVLLFHQAAGSAAEYDAIGWRLYKKGYSVLAIDARAGGDLFGRPNKTATAYQAAGGVDPKRDWMQALPDLEAALAWAKTRPGGKRVLLWGSSYSAALSFVLAARHPKRVAGILAFSPGEYLRAPNAVAKAAAQVTVPVFIMTPAKEKATIAPVLTALTGKDVTAHVLETAVHGSSALIAKRCPKAEAHWPLVDAFLKRFPLLR